MAEKKSKKEEMKENEAILERKKFVQKFGLTRKELETVVQDDLEFRNHFILIDRYLQQAKVSILHEDKEECGHFIERAKYVLRGCKE